MPSSKRLSRDAKRSGDSPIAAVEESTPAKKLKSNGKTPGKKKDRRKEDHAVKKEASEWDNEELQTLITNINSSVPKNDSLRYDTAARKFDWAQVQFGNRSKEDCCLKWHEITKRLRKYRTMTELAIDAEEWVKHPWSHYISKKQKRHPDLPKKPLTPYFRYLFEKRQKYVKKHPEVSVSDLSKIIAAKFNEMSAKKKAKYTEAYNKEFIEYKERLENFKLEHPDYDLSTGLIVKDRKNQDCIAKLQTPFQLFRTNRLIKLGELDHETKAQALQKIKQCWETLSEGKRVKWIRKAVLDQSRYFTELENYCASHPDYEPPKFKSAITKFENELKDRFDGKPDKPPNSGYKLYSKIVLKELCECPIKERMTEMARRWKNLTDSERKLYNEQSTELNDSYKQRYENYLSTLSEAERDAAVKVEEASRNIKKKSTPLKVDQPKRPKLPKKKKKKKEKKKKRKSLKNEPKRPPMNAKALFFSEVMRELNSVEPKQRMKEVSKRWKEVSPEEKEEYDKKVVNLLYQYKIDYAKFIKKLKPEDHLALELSKSKRKRKSTKSEKETKTEHARKPSSSEDISGDEHSNSGNSSVDSDSSHGKYVTSSDHNTSDNDDTSSEGSD